MSTKPFDPKVSAELDVVITKLDAQPTGFPYRWLKLRKRWLERHVPRERGR